MGHKFCFSPCDFRFPADSLLRAFGVLSMRPITFLSRKELEEFGNEEVKTLIDHYGHTKTVSWEEDGTKRQESSPPLIDAQAPIKEWNEAKQTALAEKYPRDSTWKLWSLLSKHHNFPNLQTLAALALTIAVQTAGCEWGLSIQNLTLTPHRNRLSLVTQDQLMRVKLGPTMQEFDFEEALHQWRNKKGRRLYEMKYTK